MPEPIQGEVIQPLSGEEKAKLAMYEAEIEKDQERIEKHSLSQARRLINIRKELLYREYGTWDQYLHQRWGHDKTWYSRQLTAIELNDKLAAYAEVKKVAKLQPLSPSETGALKDIENFDSRFRAVLMAEAKARLTGQKRTAALVEEAVNEIRGEVTTRSRKTSQAEKLRGRVQELEQELAKPAPAPPDLSTIQPQQQPQAAASQTLDAAQAQQLQQQRDWIAGKLAALGLAVTVEQAIALLEALGVAWAELHHD